MVATLFHDVTRHVMSLCLMSVLTNILGSKHKRFPTKFTLNLVAAVMDHMNQDVREETDVSLVTDRKNRNDSEILNSRRHQSCGVLHRCTKLIPQTAACLL